MINIRKAGIIFYLFTVSALGLPQASANTREYALGNKEYDEKCEVDPCPSGNFTSLVIPLKRAQNLLIVEARVNGMTGNFVLDTGAPNLVLNKTYFRNGKASSSATVGITGEEGTVYHTTIESLAIQDLYFTALSADLIDLRHLEDSRGIKILGLLGADLFSQLEMEIDIRHNVLYLRKLKDDGESLCDLKDSCGIKPDLLFPVETIGDIVFLDCFVSGKKLRFCFDTGAETNVLSTNVSNKILAKFQLANRIALSGAGSGKSDVLNGELQELTLGDHVFNNIPFILSGLSTLQEVYNTTVNGVLGYYFLSQGRIIINPKKKLLTMYFYKRGEV